LVNKKDLAKWLGLFELGNRATGLDRIGQVCYSVMVKIETCPLIKLASGHSQKMLL
jgi:hypothetical protein